METSKESSFSSEQSSMSEKRKKAYEAIDKIEAYQRSTSYVDPSENKFSGNGRGKVSSVLADLSFGYDKSKEYFHVTVDTEYASYERWVYMRKTNRGTYIYNVNSLTKTYTRRDYSSSSFQEELDECIPYLAVKEMVSSVSSYELGKRMLDGLGSTYEEETIVSEKYTYGDDGDFAATIRIKDGDNDITESFAYKDYVGVETTRKGTVEGASINTSTTLDYSYCDASYLPNLNGYTENS